MARLLNKETELPNEKSIAMKRLSVSALLVLFIVLSACTREKEEIVNPKIMGKWMLDRTVEEDYHPIHTLIDSEEHLGKAGDSIIFLANKTVIGYTDDGEFEENEWRLINDSTIRIEVETFKIRKLTDTEFYLHEEEVDNTLDEKWVYRIYLKR
jgi:hypothetical protein